jgi:hypothetical protein
MPSFPQKESDIIRLAGAMVNGLKRNASLFPNPPVVTGSLELKLNDYEVKKQDNISKIANAEKSTKEKNRTMKTLIEAMKANLRYAEFVSNYEDDKLKLLGWSGPKSRSRAKLPGQVRELEIAHIEPGKISLEWKSPSNGGKIAVYKVKRREKQEGDWLNIDVVTKTQTILSDQIRGREIEYTVAGFNRAGDGKDSNIVTAVI